MEQVLTLVCKLQPTAEQAKALDATLWAFAEACAYIHATLPERIANVMRMQGMIYHDVRGRFGLSANLTQQAFRRVAGNRKTARATGTTITAFNPTSATFDQRIFSFRERDWTVSLTLKGGRARLALALGTYQRGTLKGQSPTSATLVKRHDSRYFLHIQVKSTLPPPHTPTDVLGVDLGRTDIAHTSDDQDWSGQDLRAVRDHYSRLRGGLQQKASKGTRSTRRRCRELLHRLSGRERRFQRHTNHCIAKTLVETAQSTGRSLALEDLTGIRERTNGEVRPKTERRRANTWAFYQLRQFIAYKAQTAGVIVDLVPPAYTSKMCHQCLHLGSRVGKTFRCTNPACGWAGDADFNGAQNIKTLGRQVRTPRGPWMQCSWPCPPGSQKAHVA